MIKSEGNYLMKGCPMPLYKVTEVCQGKTVFVTFLWVILE